MVAIMFLRVLLIPYGLFQFKNAFFCPSFLANIVAAHGLKLKGLKSSRYHVINSSEP